MFHILMCFCFMNSSFWVSSRKVPQVNQPRLWYTLFGLHNLGKGFFFCSCHFCLFVCFFLKCRALQSAQSILYCLDFYRNRLLLIWINVWCGHDSYIIIHRNKGLKLFDMFVVTCRLSEMRQATVRRQCTVRALVENNWRESKGTKDKRFSGFYR